MMRRHLYSLFLFFFTVINSHAQFNFQWKDGFMGPGEAYVHDVDEDAAGNTYIIGQYSGTIDFDPGPAIANRTSMGNIDPFFAKYDVNGNLVWLNVIPVDFSGWPTAPSKLKIANNSVYVGGTFIGTSDFDPGPGIANVAGVGNLAPFFGRYDLNGNYIWVKTVGSLNNDHVTGLDVDATGNFYLSFVSGGVGVDFDPGPGVAAVPVSWNDGVIGKYDPNGNYMFAKAFSSTGANWHPAMDIALDNAGNMYVAGTFESTVDIDPGAGVINMVASGFSLDAYIAKFNAAGNYLWHGQYTGNGNEIAVVLETDLADNSIYCAGFFGSPAVDMNFGPGTNDLTITAAENGFLAKYNSAGTYLWSVNINGNGTESVSDIDLDPCQNVYISGNFNSSSMNLDPSVATSFGTNGAEDFFMAKYSNAGAYINAFTSGGPFTDVASSLSINGFNGRISLGGVFNQTVDFDPGAGTSLLNAGGVNNGYLATYSESPPQPADLTPAANLSVCPGDSTVLIVNGSAAGTVYWYDSTGTLIGTGDTLFTGPVNTTTIFIFKDSLYCLPASTPDTIIVNVGNINVSITASDTSICVGNSVTLTGSGASSFIWNPGGSTATSITVTPASTTTYSLYGHSSTCYDTAKITIHVHTIPVLNIQANTNAICMGSSATITASGAGSYQWNPGGATTNPLVVGPAATTTYTVTGSNGNCSSTASLTIQVLPNPSVSLGNDLTICDTTITLSPVIFSGLAPFTYVWNDLSTLSSLHAGAAGVYHVTVTDSNHCQATDSLLLQNICPPALYIPNCFTPNGDGFNPLFMARGRNIKSFRMEVFNRWGQLMKRLDDINQGWDGTYNGTEAPQAVYVYRVTYQDKLSGDEHVLMGGFSLIR